MNLIIAIPALVNFSSVKFFVVLRWFALIDQNVWRALFEQHTFLWFFLCSLCSHFPPFCSSLSGIPQTCVNLALINVSASGASEWDISSQWSLARAPLAGEIAVLSEDSNLFLPDDSSTEVFELILAMDSTLYFGLDSEILITPEEPNSISPKFAFVNSSAFSFEFSMCPIPASGLYLRAYKESSPSVVAFEAQVTADTKQSIVISMAGSYTIKLFASGSTSPLYTESVYLSHNGICVSSESSCKLWWKYFFLQIFMTSRMSS